MQIAIWIIQGLLVLAFLLAGVMKATQPASKIRENMPWANDVSDGKIKFIGVSELLGAFGLLIPQLTGILAQLTWLSAVALAVVMVLAMSLHAKRGEKKEIIFNLVLFVMLLFIAYSRFYCAIL